ncbi:DUF1214 domain-containing protein [Hellea sp.]|nr:DUF1214 domain-containing protein [Hellea sp.]
MSDISALWKEFCQKLEAAGEHVIGSNLASSELDEAEGVRYLTRLLRVGLDMHLENADPAFPSFYQASHATAKIGSDNPDNFYQNATISGAHSYRIRGQRGSVPILSFGTKANRYAIDGSMASTGELDIRDVTLEADGSFEIIVSRDKRPGNWLPLSEDSSILIVRQTFFNRAAETPATVTIEAIDAPSYPAPLSADSLSSSLARVPAFIGGTSAIFLQWAELFKRENKNTLNTVDQSMFFKAGGDPMIYYLHGWWELEEGQALRITSSIPECEGWNFQINNIWMESLDYRHHTIHTNNELAQLNDDGTVTVTVLAKPKDGHWPKNHIDTAAHHRGTMLWRWTGAKDHPIPKVELINV